MSSRFGIWSVWLLASLFYAYQYVLRVLPNILMPQIMEQFGIGAAAFGQFSGLYYLGYAGFHIPLGIMFDRVGPKVAMSFCILLTLVGLLPLLYSSAWTYPCAGRFLIGVGSSGAILAVFTIIRVAFPKHYFSRMLGFSVTIGLLGAIYGGGPVYYMLENFGVDVVLKTLIIFGICLALLSFIVTPAHKIHAPTHRPLWTDLKHVLAHKRILILCILGGLMVGPLEGFADVWGTEFLKISYGIEGSKAAFLPSLIFIGMCVGSPLLSYIAERFNAYYTCIIISACIMGVSFALLLTGLLTPTIFGILFFLVGMMCAYQILLIYTVSTYVEPDLTGLVTAYANMIIMSFGYIFHSSIGWLLHTFWEGNMNGSTPIYSSTAFIKALSIIPLGLFISVIGLGILMKKKKSKC